MPPQAPIPVPAASKPRGDGTGKGLWIGLAALLLAGVGGTSWWFLRGGAPAASSAPRTDTEGAPAASTPASGTVSASASPAQGASASPTGKAAPTGAGPQAEARPESIHTAPPASEPRTESRMEPRTELKAVGKSATPSKSIDQPELYQQEKLEKLQVHERLNLGNVSLSEAIQLADSEPDKAIHGFRQAIKADPYNVNAHAWLAVVLHDQGRTPEFVQEIREARRQGILGQMVARNARFRSVLSQARFNRKLPADLMD